MSFSIDVNILLYASAAASPFHARAEAFLRARRAGSEVFCLAWPTVMGYLRMSTNPAILSPPLSPERAMANVAALIELPHVRLLSEQEGFWQVYREITGGLVVRGKLVPDAHLAALLRQHGVDTLFTDDDDFHRFPFLRVKNPLVDKPRT